MTIGGFLDAISAGGRTKFAPSKPFRPFTTKTAHSLLGAILLDDAGFCFDDVMQGTTILVHDDQDVCDCVHEALAQIVADDVRVLMHGTWFDIFDDAVNDGTPIVIVTFDRAVVFPRDAVLLADRVIDLGDVGRPEVVAAFIKAITGSVVRLTRDEAASFEPASLIRCVGFAASGEDVELCLMGRHEERRVKTLAADATAAARSPRRTDLKG